MKLSTGVNSIIRSIHLSIFVKFIINISLLLAMSWLSTISAIHTYFFGVIDLQSNNKTQYIKVIRQFTAHDIENTIAKLKQVSFSPEHANYDIYIKEYFQPYFFLH